jgi:hypothetical protein
MDGSPHLCEHPRRAATRRPAMSRFISQQLLSGTTAMTNNKFTVGIKVDGRHHSVTVIAEDALVAALKVKLEQPAAAINFVRRCNRRGDLRHPHGAIAAALQP